MAIPFSSPIDQEDSRKSPAKCPTQLEISFNEISQSSRLYIAAMTEALDILQTIVSDQNQQICNLKIEILATEKHQQKNRKKSDKKEELQNARSSLSDLCPPKKCEVHSKQSDIFTETEVVTAATKIPANDRNRQKFKTASIKTKKCM